MSIVAKEDVQQWLEQTKLTLTELDASLTATATTLTFATIGSVYDTTLWTTTANTPAIIKVIVSMLIAAWTHNRAYSENSGPSDYGLWLEEKAMSMLDGLKNGEIDITEIPGQISDTLIAFYPNDLTGMSDIYDANGKLIGLAGAEDIKFAMGTRF